MQIHGVLIDLDLTLVDSQIAAAVRKSRRWPAVYEMIPRFTRYDGVSELLVELRENDIGVCVVTSSPQPYCSRVLQHFEWKDIKTVCYHDTRGHKLIQPRSCAACSYSTFSRNTQSQSATIRLTRLLPGAPAYSQWAPSGELRIGKRLSPQNLRSCARRWQNFER